MTTWDLVVKERTAIIEQLDSALAADDWDRPTLCPDWRVRDVVAHMTFPPKMGAAFVARSIPAMARARFDVDRLVSNDAITRGSDPIERLVADFRAGIASQAKPPGRTPEHVLDDLFVHSQDIRRVLGLPWSHEPAVLELVAKTVAADKRLGVPARVQGLRLRAIDTGFEAGGSGEAPVTGPSEALILAMCGRTVVLDELDGAGVAALRARIGS